MVAMRPTAGLRGLWRNPDFLRLWAGETVSLVGSQITTLALPLAAVLTLQATPVQVGLLSAARFAPFLLLTLFVGVWVDRHKRRPILIAANLGRAVVLGLVPLLALTGSLRLAHLYIVAFLSGGLTVLFDLAYQSYLPTLIPREQLVEGNSKLQSSASAAVVGGPGLAGLLISAFTPPLALLLDAVSFLVSVLTLVAIRHTEPAPASPQVQQGWWPQIRKGLGVTFGNPYLRAIASEATTYNLFGTWVETLYVLYAVRELGLGPAALGTTLALGSVGSLLGSLFAGRWAERLGVGRAIVGAMVLACLSPLLLLAAGTWRSVAVPMLVLSFFLGGIGLAVSNVTVVSLRQAIIPKHFLGRINASYRFFIYAGIPIGGLRRGPRRSSGATGGACDRRGRPFVGAATGVVLTRTAASPASRRGGLGFTIRRFGTATL